MDAGKSEDKYIQKWGYYFTCPKKHRLEWFAKWGLVYGRK
jgi:hypothetical protein